MVGLSQMNRSSLRERERKREREREGEGERDVFLHSWNACQSRVPWRFAGKTVCVWMMASIYLYLSISIYLSICGKTWQYSALGQTFFATCVLSGAIYHSVAAIRHNIQCPYWAPHFREKRGRCHCWDSAVPQW